MPIVLQQLVAQLREGEVGRLGATVARVVEGTYVEASTWTQAHLTKVGLMLVASLLSLYAGRVSLALRRHTHAWPFPLRLAAFVVLVGLGFGTVVGALGPLVSGALAHVATPYVIPTVLAAFIVVGILAERHDRI